MEILNHTICTLTVKTMKYFKYEKVVNERKIKNKDCNHSTKILYDVNSMHAIKLWSFGAC